ncbi:MAG: hypothetical protein LUQ47_03830 [Methanotrichaceae archaeon]|nr:hypothetical protein [Methanotrichaceae archaeon]
MKAGILVASLALLIAIVAGIEMVSMGSQLELDEPVAFQEKPPPKGVSGLNAPPSGSTDDNLGDNKNQM